MKKNLLIGAGCAALMCVAGGVSAANEGYTAGYTYSDVYMQYAKPYQSLHGARGPIRSDESAAMTESLQRYDGDMYDAYRLPSQTLKGALGPIRTAEIPSDVAASEAWWTDTKHRARILGDND